MDSCQSHSGVWTGCTFFFIHFWFWAGGRSAHGVCRLHEAPQIHLVPPSHALSYAPSWGLSPPASCRAHSSIRKCWSRRQCPRRRCNKRASCPRPRPRNRQSPSPPRRPRSWSSRRCKQRCQRRSQPGLLPSCMQLTPAHSPSSLLVPCCAQPCCAWAQPRRVSSRTSPSLCQTSESRLCNTTVPYHTSFSFPALLYCTFVLLCFEGSCVITVASF